MEQFITVTEALMKGFGETMNIFLLTLVFSIPLGLLVCFGTMTRFSPVRYVMKCIVWVIRGTPLMLQLIVVFYGPGLLFGLPAMGPVHRGDFVLFRELRLLFQRNLPGGH